MSAMSEPRSGAPVLSATEIAIDAPREVVWAVLTGIDRWPSWNPAVKSASLQGSLEKGEEFRWKAGPGTIVSRLEDVDAPSRIAWSGRSMGIKAVHVHTLEQRDGRTLVRSEESYEGLIARIFSGRLRRMLDDALRDGLRHLKAEAERQSSMEGARAD
jgi:carbon monoxide dehydrogenase subunit G